MSPPPSIEETRRVSSRAGAEATRVEGETSRGGATSREIRIYCGELVEARRSLRREFGSDIYERLPGPYWDHYQQQRALVFYEPGECREYGLDFDFLLAMVTRRVAVDTGLRRTLLTSSTVVFAFQDHYDERWMADLTPEQRAIILSYVNEIRIHKRRSDREWGATLADLRP
jgi:hypothetical protein